MKTLACDMCDRVLSREELRAAEAHDSLPVAEAAGVACDSCAHGTLQVREVAELEAAE